MIIFLGRTGLSIDIEDIFIFKRPVYKDPGHPTEEEKAKDDKVRYEAWGIVEGGGRDEQVYEARYGMHNVYRCYVILTQREYDPNQAPKPVKTMAFDKEVLWRKNEEAKKIAKRKALTDRRLRLRKAFEIVPSCHNGVNYGTEQRVLIRTKDKVLLYSPGHTSYVSRGTGSDYFRSAIVVRKINHKKCHNFPYTILYDVEKEFPLPVGFRLAPKHLFAFYTEIERQLDLRAGTLLKSWDLEKTLVIK